MTTEQAPSHLAPENCYVCALPKEQHGTRGTHTFWSNADAAKEFAKEPQGNDDVEARYVSQHRPY